MIFTPWLNGERTPVDDHRLRGGWHDLSLQTTRADLVRSVLEGVAYNSRWLLGCVERFTGKPFPSLNFIGGGAQSRLWCRIMADVLDRPIRQVEHPIRANARGAAALAALTLGQTTIDDIARSVDIVETFYARSVDPAGVRRALSRVPRDPQADQGHLHEVERHMAEPEHGHRPDEANDQPMRGWGLPLPGELDRVVIVSPHLDDAVLGCGNFMAAHPGVVVVTVFAGQSARVPHGPDAQVGRAIGIRARRRRDGDPPPRRRRRARRARREAGAPRVRRAHLQPRRPAGRTRRARRRARARAGCPRPDARARAVRAREPRPRRDAPRVHAGARAPRTTACRGGCYEDNGYKHIPGMLAWRIVVVVPARRLADARVPGRPT